MIEGRGPMCVAFSPDGRRVAAAAAAVYVWDFDRGEERRVRSLSDVQSPKSCRFTSDSSRVIVSTESGEKVVSAWIVSPKEEGGAAVAFSGDAKRRVEASGARVTVYEEARAIALLRSATEVLTAAAFSPDRQRLVTPERDGMVRIWNVATGAREGASRS